VKLNLQPQPHSTVCDFFFRFFPERIIFISGFVDVLVIRAKEDEQDAHANPYPAGSFGEVNVDGG
jgi:hypothetical protein